MEGSFEKTKNVYKGKIPEMEQTLELLQIMKIRVKIVVVMFLDILYK